MRRRRVIVFDDDIVITGLLKKFFVLRDYDVVTFREPVTCPIYSNRSECDTNGPCADIMIVDYRMSVMNGIDLLRTQQTRKCGLTSKNKALVTGYADALDRSAVEELGCTFFEKPLDFQRLAAWFDECEQRMDLSHPLGLIRREVRRAWKGEVAFQAPPSDDIFKGVAVNRSTSGLCLKIAVTVCPDQSLTLLSPNRQFARSATVRWTKKLAENEYLAGLQFEESASAAVTASRSASHP